MYQYTSFFVLFLIDTMFVYYTYIVVSICRFGVITVLALAHIIQR